MSCQLETVANVFYSSSTLRDEITVSVQGSSCKSSDASIIITDASGNTEYRFENQLAEFAVGSGDLSEAEMRSFGQKLIDSIIPTAPLHTSSTLRPYQAGPYQPDPFSNEEIIVDEATYKRLRFADVPVFMHSTSQERWTYIVYDSSQARSLEIVRGWF